MELEQDLMASPPHAATMKTATIAPSRHSPSLSNSNESASTPFVSEDMDTTPPASLGPENTVLETLVSQTSDIPTSLTHIDEISDFRSRVLNAQTILGQNVPVRRLSTSMPVPMLEIKEELNEDEENNHENKENYEF